jgi:hypothetical protein
MGQFKPNLTRIHLEDQILAKWGPEKIEEFRARLCKVCVFHELHGRPCGLLPITSEGKDCGYFATTVNLPAGDTQNG